jgi:hypothetical protein
MKSDLNQVTELEVNSNRVSMMSKRQLFAIALVVSLAFLGIVAAQETGVIDVTIGNSPDSRVNTNISNSTVTEQANYTNTKATQDITLTNSTLTLNVNGNTVVINSTNGGLTVSTSGQNNSKLAPLDIADPPEWIGVEQTGGFNVLGVATSQDCYTFYITVAGGYQSQVAGLPDDLTSAFPAEFYHNFGLETKAISVHEDGYYTLSSGAHVDCQSSGTRSGFQLALFLDANHQSNTYLPDKYDNSGEQYLAQAIAYYVGQYLQSH